MGQGPQFVPPVFFDLFVLLDAEELLDDLALVYLVLGEVARDELLSLLLRFKSLLYLEESLQKVRGNRRVLNSTK